MISTNGQRTDENFSWDEVQNYLKALRFLVNNKPIEYIEKKFYINKDKITKKQDN